MIGKCIKFSLTGHSITSAFAALAIVIAGLSLSSSGADAAIFGRDDRGPIPKDLAKLGEQIGRLHNPETGTNCTAFCVAPNMVATAAHCLFRKPKGRTLRMTDFRFELFRNGAQQQSKIEGAAVKGASQHILTGTTRLRVRPPIDAGSDWALIRTEANICRNRVLPVEVQTIEQIEKSSDRKEMFQVAYHSDYKDWELAYSRPCKMRSEFPDLRRNTIGRDFKNTRNLILHQCDTKGASSGSPILRRTENGPVVVGINVGTYIQSKVLIRNGEVTRKFEARPVANTAVNAAVFKSYIDVLRKADILVAKDDIKRVQTVLHRADTYRGAIDGVYGNGTRKAIRAYQLVEGQLVTGLPTRDMLPVVVEKAPPAPARNPLGIERYTAEATDGINQLLLQID